MSGAEGPMRCDVLLWLRGRVRRALWHEAS